MQKIGDMDKIASAFLSRNTDTWLSTADLHAATGIDNSDLYLLLARMQRRGWITDGITGTAANPALAWVMTDRGRTALSPSWRG